MARTVNTSLLIIGGAEDKVGHKTVLRRFVRLAGGMCVDKHAIVLSELEDLTHQAQAGAHSGETAGDPDMHPQEMQDAAQASGDEASQASGDEAAAPVEV
jgi:cyanophycinase-like exopeptidase